MTTDTYTPPDEKDIPSDAKWYVVHTYSGREDRTCKNLLQSIESLDMKEYIFDAVVPKQTVVQMTDGERKEKQITMYPGYLLVRMKMNDEAWFVVRNTPGVTNFISVEDETDGRQKPTPLTEAEAERMIQSSDASNPQVNFGFDQGDVVTIKDGPFADFSGTVDEVMGDKGEVKVTVSFFGQDTPVTLPFLSVEKA